MNLALSHSRQKLRQCRRDEALTWGDLYGLGRALCIIVVVICSTVLIIPGEHVLVTELQHAQVAGNGAAQTWRNRSSAQIA